MKGYRPVILAAFLLTVLALASATLTPSHTEAAASPAFAPVTAVPFYRFYQPGYGYHFYTADPDERAALKGQPGWVEEQQEGYVFRQYAPGTVPLYRVVKGGVDGGVEHFYTINPAEVDAAKPGGWKTEGVACFVSPTQIAGTMPLYRLYKPVNEDALAAVKDAESGGAFTTYGNQDIGDDQFYTIDGKQKFEAIYQGYQLIRAEGYVWTQPVTLGASPKPPSPAPLPESYYTDQLFNLGCGKTAEGGVTCPTKNGYFTCEYYRKQGNIKATSCVANFDLASFNKIEANIVDLGCKRFAGRPGEYICESWTGGDACDAAVKMGNGLITKCFTPRMFLVASYQKSFGREPTAKEIDYWSGEIKAKKLAYTDMMKNLMAVNSQWVKTAAASAERKGVANRSVYEAFGRYATVDEINTITDKIEKEGTSYADLVKGHMNWLLGGGGQQLPEFIAMIQRAYSAAGLPKPTDAQLQKSVADVTTRRLTFKQLMATLKK
jgi:hypothetical protein